MCRLLAWLGAPRTVRELVLDPEWGLVRQSYAPRRQSHGLVNADGWGVAWWTPSVPEPARWRSTRPLWQDAGQSFGSVSGHVRAGCVIASVRSATTGMPIEETATAPFTRGAWALTHNGVVDRSAVPAGSTPPESVCDSAVLAAWLLDSPTDLGERITTVGLKDPEARLNVIASDGTRLLATAWGDTLTWRTEADGVIVASEAIDDRDGWIDLPDKHLMSIGPDGVTINPLEGP